ncbi:MAG: malonic semialdehyde reductase [Alphaproteobacteria bacterium]
MPMMLTEEGLNLLFYEARTQNKWKDADVTDDQLKLLHDLTSMGPTSANCCPMRVVFVKSDAEKERLKPALMEGNVEKTLSAPVVAIIGTDYEFHEHLPKLFPHTDAKSWFAGEKNKANREVTAFRNATLQAGYFIMAARSIGLDCGPMSGFNNDMVDELYFEGTSTKSNFLCNLGYGDPEGLFPRSPRFDFDEACKIV